MTKLVLTPLINRVLDGCVEEDRGYSTPCLIWTGATIHPLNKYGWVSRGRREDGNVATHVAVWEHSNGPKPEGMEVDHLCRVTLCCRLDHLEVVTKAENLRRTRGELCKAGLHAMTGENLLHPESGTGWRRCRACKNEAERRRNRMKMKKVDQ